MPIPRFAQLSTIRGRIQLLILATLLPSIALVAYNAFAARARERHDVQMQAYRITLLVAATQERLAETTGHLFSALEQVPAVAQSDSPDCHDALARVLAAADRFQNLGVMSPDGVVRCAGHAVAPGTSVADRPWFRTALQAPVMTVSGYEETPVVPRPTVFFARRTPAGDVLFAALSLEWLSRIGDTVPLPPSSTITVLDEHGRMVARHPESGALLGRNVGSSPGFAAALAQGDGVSEAVGLDQVQRLYGYHRVAMPAGSDFLVSVGIPRDVAYAATNRHLQITLMVLALTTLGTLIGARYVSQRVFTRRIERLLDAARRLSAGDLAARTGDTGHSDELGELVRGFDTMAETLQQRTASLEELTESLRGLAARLEAVREEERTRISREIHDELGQNLTGIRMDLDRLEERIRAAVLAGPDREMVQKKIESIRVLADATLDNARRISRHLRPSVLDVLGLRSGIEWQLEEFQARTSVATDLLWDDSVPELDEQTSIVIFRILQEALTNVARHADASSVTVTVASENAELIMDVEDNGRGFVGDDRPTLRSLGLLGMRERAASVGGETSISSSPGHGTRVHVRLPILSGKRAS